MGMNQTTRCATLVAAIGVAAATSSFANELVHRWSFNGDLTDSVGDSPATTIGASGTVNYVGGVAVRTGSDQAGTYATSLNLGTSLVTGNEATIEIWGSRSTLLNGNMRVFDWGPGTGNYLCMSWRQDPVIWIRNRADSSAISECFTDNVRYHIVLTVKTYDDGSSAIHFIRRNVDDLSDVKTCDETVSDWRLSLVASGNLYLGHSQWPNESTIDATAIYDEVRVWNGIVPNALLGLSAAMGPDTLAFSYGEDGKANIYIAAGETFPIDANTLGSGYVLDGSVTLGAGATIQFDTENYPGGMTFTAEGGFNVPSGSVTDYVTLTSEEGYDVAFDGNTIAVKSAASTFWSGAAGDCNWSNAANWTRGVPTADTDVTILASATTMPQTPAACKSFTILGGSFSADTDWRGLAVKPVLSGNVNLNGHNLTMPAIGITAMFGAAFSNSAETDGEVRFYANDGIVTATESAFIEGIANLTTAANAKIAIIHNVGDDTGTLNVGVANNHTVFRIESGTISMTANGQVAMVGGSTGYLDISGGTLDFCTANDRGMQLGTANARSFVNISGGKLRANWIDAGHDNVIECKIVQTGGEVETGINNNGNIWLGRNSRGSATYLLSGGSINATRGTLDVGNYGTGVFVQDGGSITLGNSDLRVGWFGNGTYTLNDGSIASKYWVLVGQRNGAVGTFTQNGGTVTLVIGDNADGNWLNIGEYASAHGTYTINGGTVEVGTGPNGGGIFVGRTGTGRFVMNGGTVITPTLISDTGIATVVLNGGTLKVARDGGSASSRHANDIGIIKNIDNVVFGNGTTIDTNGHSTKITECGFETLSDDSSLTKVGEGKLTVDSIPPVTALTVTEGTLALVSGGDNAAAVALGHRWSFNGKLTDSVGNTPATAIGSVNTINYVDGVAVRTGSDQAGTYATSLNLGSALVAGESATLEIWASRDTLLNGNMRVFDWGPGTGNYLCMPWRNDSVIWIRNRADSPAIGGCFAEDVKYHIAMAIRANGDGTSAIHFVRRKVDDLSDVTTCDETVPNWTLSLVASGNLYLGHSQWSNESNIDAAAIYDEVRVWRGALSDDAIALSAQKGPDASESDIEAIIAKNGETASVSRSLTLAPGATLDLGGNTLRQPVVSATGKLANGKLVVTECVNATVGQTLALDGDASLDLTGAEINVTDLANLPRDGWTFATSPSGSIVPAEPRKLSGALEGYTLFLSPTKARIGKVGFVLFVE